MIKIKHMFIIFFSFFKRYIILILAFILIIAGYLYFTRDKLPKYEFIVAHRAGLKQEVSVTGKVKPTSKVDLAFEISGKVSTLYVDVGDMVYLGQKVAVLNNAQYRAQYNQSIANWKEEQSKLDELKAGTRPEKIAVQKVKVQNAEQSLVDTKNNMVIKIRDSFTKTDDAIRNKTDRFFDNPRSTNPQLNFTTSSILKSKIESSRFSMEGILNQWSLDVVSGSVVLENLSNQIQKTKQDLNDSISFLDVMSLVVNEMSKTSNLSQATIDGYKSDMNLARTNVNIALSNLFMAEEKLKNAESSLILAQQELILEEAGPILDKVEAQESKVASAKANVDNFKALLNKTILRSPISGVVTKKNVEVGEIISANNPVVTVISGAKFEIEAFIPEADIAKVRKEDKAQVTLDAYNDDVNFSAEVTFIDPAETVIDGVSTYKTKLKFAEKDERIKSGMTANVEILTASRENVISVPYRALIIKGLSKYVEVLKGDGILEKREVKTGLRSSEGNLEIVSGIKEGEKIVIGK